MTPLHASGTEKTNLQHAEVQTMGQQQPETTAEKTQRKNITDLSLQDAASTN